MNTTKAPPPCTACGSDEMCVIHVQRGTMEVHRDGRVMPGALVSPPGHKGHRFALCTVCGLMQGHGTAQATPAAEAAVRPVLRVVQGGA